MAKCVFCGEETTGKQFEDSRFDTGEKTVNDVCDNCYGDDLKLIKSE